MATYCIARDDDAADADGSAGYCRQKNRQRDIVGNAFLLEDREEISQDSLQGRFQFE